MTPEERRAFVARRDPENVRARDRERAKTPERQEQVKRTVRNWRAKNPARARAHRAVSYAIRTGRLIKGGCELEDENCRGPIHGHHDDYAKPLEVRWVCGHHHHVVIHPTGTRAREAS
jgi:hypothetical protein